MITKPSCFIHVQNQWPPAIDCEVGNGKPVVLECKYFIGEESEKKVLTYKTGSSESDQGQILCPFAPNPLCSACLDTSRLSPS
jgi:hypothetical protein